MKDYTKFSSNNKIEEKVEEPIVSGFVQAEEIDDEADFVTLSSDTVKTGVVSGCKKLNVREEPDFSAEVVCQLPEGTEVIIEEAVSTDDFYKVCMASGMEGYCMKKFITLVE